VKIHPRYAAVGAGVLALATLAACGSDNNKSSSSSSGGTTTTSSPASGTSSSAAGGSSIACGSATLIGQGSSAQNNAITQWIKDYQNACSGAQITYTANGSGAGITAFTNKTADWAGSDFPLSSAQQTPADARCTGGKAVSIATVPGAIALMYNVPGTTSLNLSAKTLGGIFDGKITDWSDPAIAADNGGKALAPLKIQAFHRSDASGTSFNFSQYLNKVAPDAFPHAANKAWPGSGGQGASGSKGVTTAVQSTSGAIGYAEISYATSAKLSTANIGNAAGQFVSLSTDNAKEFLSKSKVDTTNGNIIMNFDYTVSEPNAYPAVLVTYEIVCTAGNDSGKLSTLQGFLGYAASDAAQAKLPDLGYVALPDSLKPQVQAAFAGIK
jgi:phosphate transport system substrate-binding protein